MAQHRSALGRGLDSLISMDDTPARGTSAINDIELSQISPNPEQPRTTFDEEALDELASSIRELGIIQPLFQTVEQIVKSGVESVGQSLKNCTLAVQVDSMYFPP